MIRDCLQRRFPFSCHTGLNFIGIDALCDGLRQAAAHGQGLVEDVQTSEFGLTFVGGQISGQQAHGRGFARAVGAEESYDLALRDVEVDMVDYCAVAEALGEILRQDHKPFRL